MKAAVLHEFAQPLSVEEMPAPEPGPGEVLIKVAACGICHSDLHLAQGEWDLLKPITKTPLVLGHEVTGTIAALGKGVTEFKPGDRVGVPWLHYTCGECEYCLAGRETLCAKQQITGCTVDGGYAEFLTAKASHTVRLPENLGFEEAAPLLCAGLTVYTAMKNSGIQPGQTIAIFGVGGLGHLAVQLAVDLGAHVTAVDVADDKLELAKELGAANTVNASAPQAYKEIKKLTGGGAHVVMVTSGSRAAYEMALRSLRRGGTLSIVGMAPEAVPLSTVAMVSGEYRIVASAVGTRRDLRALLDLASQGKVHCRIKTCGIQDINTVLEDMKLGRLVGRVVMKI